jgi:hypothetical protein
MRSAGLSLQLSPLAGFVFGLLGAIDASIEFEWNNLSRHTRCAVGELHTAHRLR